MPNAHHVSFSPVRKYCKYILELSISTKNLVEGEWIHLHLLLPFLSKGDNFQHLVLIHGKAEKKNMCVSGYMEFQNRDNR